MCITNLPETCKKLQIVKKEKEVVNWSYGFINRT